MQISPNRVRSIGAIAALLLILANTSAAATEEVLHSFNANGNGYQPNGGLISDDAGNLYGVTAYGGNFNLGSVYQLTRDPKGGWKEKAIYSFKGDRDLASPGGTLTLDSAGNLYGAALGGPANGGGIFELMPTADGAWKEIILRSFAIRSSIYNPGGGLILDQTGRLYGVAAAGTNNGVVFQLAPGSNGQWTDSIVFRFPRNMYPGGNLVFDRAGNIYGNFNGNFSSDHGGIFKLISSTTGRWTLARLYDFSGGADGAYPTGGLILDQSGNLYGSTQAGGTSGACSSYSCGTVFKLAPTVSGPWIKTVLYTFLGDADGDEPTGNLVSDQAGSLYGTTTFGGAGFAGTVFKLTPNSEGEWTKSQLWSFTAGADGGRPQSGVALGPQGEVFVATRMDGSFHRGSVIELALNEANAWSETTLTGFASTDGEAPSANLIIDRAGNLFGSTNFGGAYGFGTVFEMVKSISGPLKEITLYSFAQGGPDSNGAAPSPLILDAGGNLYGETAHGGAYGSGTIFELSRDSGKWTAKILHSFSDKDGRGPTGGLVFDVAGNLYGTTQAGGGNSACGSGGGCGAVFELSPEADGSWSETVLYAFGAGHDGATPLGGVIFDSVGSLYGTTAYGGNMYGTIFKLSANAGGWRETILYRFTGTGDDGRFPIAALVFDKAGNLFGTTPEGGLRDLRCRSRCGTIFELSPTAGGEWIESILLRFDRADGYDPNCSLIFDSFGNLYGTTAGGLTAGLVFEFSPQSGGGWKQTVLHEFPNYSFGGGPDGSSPMAGLVFGQGGNLYGTTGIGGVSNGGTVFELTP